jgi:hypothetical protein
MTAPLPAESDRLNIIFVYGMRIDMMKHFLGDTIPPTFRGTINYSVSNKVFGPHRSSAATRHGK